jgi:hypothetical protein
MMISYLEAISPKICKNTILDMLVRVLRGYTMLRPLRLVEIVRTITRSLRVVNRQSSLARQPHLPRQMDDYFK